MAHLSGTACGRQPRRLHHCGGQRAEDQRGPDLLRELRDGLRPRPGQEVPPLAAARGRPQGAGEDGAGAARVPGSLPYVVVGCKGGRAHPNSDHKGSSTEERAVVIFLPNAIKLLFESPEWSRNHFHAKIALLQEQ